MHEPTEHIHTPIQIDCCGQNETPRVYAINCHTGYSGWAEIVSPDTLKLGNPVTETAKDAARLAAQRGISVPPASYAACRIRTILMGLEEQDARTDAMSVQARQFGLTVSGDTCACWLQFYATGLYGHYKSRFTLVLCLQDGAIAKGSGCATLAEFQVWLKKELDSRVAQAVADYEVRNADPSYVAELHPAGDSV